MKILLGNIFACHLYSRVAVVFLFQKNHSFYKQFWYFLLVLYAFMCPLAPVVIRSQTNRTPYYWDLAPNSEFFTMQILPFHCHACSQMIYTVWFEISLGIRNDARLCCGAAVLLAPFYHLALCIVWRRYEFASFTNIVIIWLRC